MKLFPTEFVQQYLFMTVFIIPVVLLVIGSLGRKLARGRGWRRSDFLLGPDLILASLSVAFVNLLDIARDGIAFAGLRILLTTLFIVCCFSIFILALVWQQEYEPRRDLGKWQVFVHLLASNLVGIGLLVALLEGRLKGYL